MPLALPPPPPPCAIVRAHRPDAESLTLPTFARDGERPESIGSVSTETPPVRVHWDDDAYEGKALDAALESDPVSAFGSVIAVNRQVDRAWLKNVGKLFVEVLLAPYST